ncbi:hypothetical protein GC176_00910 [bacterium]|nr:hypothetical protein [bacterium]
MKVLRAACWLLLIASVAGCHVDTGLGYLRGSGGFAVSGLPQLWIERVQTASYHPALPPSEMASVRVERWPRTMINAESAVSGEDFDVNSTLSNGSITDPTMNWSEGSLIIEHGFLGCGRPDCEHCSNRDSRQIDASPPASGLPAVDMLPSPPPLPPPAAALDSPPPKRSVTYRRPSLQIGLLPKLQSGLASGRRFLQNRTCVANNWCRNLSQTCAARSCELQSQIVATRDKADPQRWIDSACQTCAECSQQCSATLRECTDEVCCPDWIEPACERLTSAGNRLHGTFDQVTDRFGQVTERFDPVTENADHLLPLPDVQPAVALPRPDLQRFLQPILKTFAESAEPDRQNSRQQSSTDNDAIELPAPAEPVSSGPVVTPASVTEPQREATPAPADQSAPKAPATTQASATSSPTVSTRRPVPKTDRWRTGRTSR